MSPAPRLSLCIPTSAGRTLWLQVALASAVQEALAHPPGTVEVLVSDNGSPEPTPSLLRDFQQRHPWLRVVGFPENRGFDTNYLNCFQEARGEFVWVMGDDDMFLPGCAARVIEAVDAGADAILVGAFECDAEMRPLQPRGWFLEPLPATVFQIDSRQALTDYFRLLRYEAGAFAFISSAIIRRERMLEGLPAMERSFGTGCIQVMGMMVFLESKTCLHWIPEPMFLNRTGNDTYAAGNPWGRINTDLIGWLTVAEACFPEDDDLRRAFMGVLRHNHQDTLVRSMRLTADTDRQRWREGSARLVAVGFDPALVRSVALGYDLLKMDVLPPRNLDPESLCLCDLPMVARGARRIAVLAEVGLEDFLAATALLESLRTSLPQAAIRVVCPPDLAPLLAGYDLQTFDRELFLRDDAAMHAQLDALRNYAPDLLVNLSRQRGVIGDLLADAAGAAGALAFDDETAENRDDPARLLRGRAYRRLLPADAPYPAMAAALGLQSGPERLWPDQASRDQARAALAEAGWEPGRTLALLGDDPAALAGAGAEALAKAVQAGWRVLALGGPATRALLGQALEPFGARACNLAGALSLAGMAAFLQHCGACLGGSPAFQALARAAGCRVLDQAG